MQLVEKWEENPDFRERALQKIQSRMVKVTDPRPKVGRRRVGGKCAPQGGRADGRRAASWAARAPTTRLPRTLCCAAPDVRAVLRCAALQIQERVRLAMDTFNKLKEARAKLEQAEATLAKLQAVVRKHT